jgi:hypothetical protein
MEKLTITRCLKELSTIDLRISKARTQLTPLDVSQNKYGNKALDAIMPIDLFEKYAKGAFDKVTDLMERRKKLKSALSQANAANKVTIGTEVMTIAEAIERKLRERSLLKWTKPFSVTLSQRGINIKQR